MKYFVEVGGKEHEVTVQTRPEGGYAVTIGGRPVEVDALPLGLREWSLRVGNRVADLTVEGAPPQLGVVASGRRTYVKVESERMRTASRAAGASGGGREASVRSPMPGRVVKILVAEGDVVGPGQSVVVVEAMKMENEVRAKKGGTVAKIHVVAGATVEGSAVLVSFS